MNENSLYIQHAYNIYSTTTGFVPRVGFVYIIIMLYDDVDFEISKSFRRARLTTMMTDGRRRRRVISSYVIIITIIIIMKIFWKPTILLFIIIQN